MRKILSLTTVLALVFLVLPAVADSGQRPFNAHDLVTMKRLSDPQVSPDGKWIAYGLRTMDLDAGGQNDLWLVPVDGSAEPRPLTTHDAADWGGRWAKDGKSLYFLSTRSGSVQVWHLPMNGGEARQVTDLPISLNAFKVSPDNKYLAVSMDVFVDCEDLACTTERLAEKENAKTTGVLYDRTFIRHWDTWKDGRRGHLFILPLGGEKPLGADYAVDVTTGMDADVQSKPWGGAEEWAFTPDGESIIFTARDVGHGEPWSTNFDLFQVALGGGEIEKLTTSEAWDTHPVFSPDGKTLAYTAMKRPGFEADRFGLVLRSWPDGKERRLADDWDRSVGNFYFSEDGKTVYAEAQDRGTVSLFTVDVASGKVEKVLGGSRVRSTALAGDEFVFGRDSMSAPVDLYARKRDGGDERRLTDVNHDRMAEIELGDVKRFSFEGAGGDTVEGWIFKPVGWEEGKKYPLAFMIHGGPQGSWLDQFHYRWNFQIYAAAGYAVVSVDFHGSTGYGQDFVDAIRNDWGGKPLVDLQKGLAAAVEENPWIDADRACALGASYGGYMINWIAGNWTDGFRCLVNHDGLFDLRSMYYSTEELWFPEWELGGTPWENPEGYSRHNPAEHVDKWKTPMLVIHGEQDHRVVVTQGIQTFNALQRRGIPSQFLYYPDENHWVLKPHNSIQWHETVLAWLDRWTAAD